MNIESKLKIFIKFIIWINLGDICCIYFLYKILKRVIAYSKVVGGGEGGWGGITFCFRFWYPYIVCFVKHVKLFPLHSVLKKNSIYLGIIILINKFQYYNVIRMHYKKIINFIKININFTFLQWKLKHGILTSHLSEIKKSLHFRKIEN